MTDTKTTTEYITVTMPDGREVRFPGKRKMQRASTIGEDGAITLQLDFVNGQSRSIPLPTALVLQFAAHGAIQRYTDVISGLETPDAIVEAVDGLTAQFAAGHWQQPTDATAGASVLLRALCEALGKPVESVREFLSQRSQAEKLALRKSPRIAPIVARLEAERAKASVDTDALLGQLTD